VEDLLQEDTLGVVLSVAGEVNIVLVDDGVGSLDEVEGVKSNAALLTERVEVLRARWIGMRIRALVINISSDICVARLVGGDVLFEHVV
jgi:hypothetical protein